MYRYAFFRPKKAFVFFGIRRAYCSDSAAIQQIVRDTKAEFRERYPVGSVDLHLDSDTGVAILRLNHPERRNALSGKMMAELNDRVGQLESWSEGRGVILCSALSAAPAFCSGGDLTTMKGIADSGPEGGRRMATLMHDSALRFRALPLVSVAAVHGPALGGGAELTTWCDLRAFTTKGLVSFIQVKMGLTPGWGGGSSLVRILGRSTALRLLVGGSKGSLTSESALALGYSQVTLPEVLSGEDPATLAKSWLLNEVFEANSDVSVLRAAKSVVQAGDVPSSTLAASLAVEKETFGTVWSGPAQQAALSAFFKKK